MCRYIYIFLAAICLSNTVQAHHGIANFNQNEEITLTGVITDLAFVNPHSWLYINVTDDKNNVTHWRCEMRAATVLRRSGWSKDMFRVGGKVLITGSPERSDPHACYLGTIVFEDGLSMDRYGQLERKTPVVPQQRPLRLANGDPNIGGDWAAEQKVLTDPRGFSGAFLPLSVAEKLEPGAVPEGAVAFPGTRGTPESMKKGPVSSPGNFPIPVKVNEAGARAAREYDSTTVASRLLSCHPTNILNDWIFDTHVNHIIQEPDRIILKYGFMDVERIIHINMAEHPRDIKPSFTGHSIGRWQNDILIVDTIGFIPGRLTRMSDIMYSEQMHVTERFTPDAEGKSLTRTYIAEDPLYFEEQYAGTDIVYIADLPYESYNCEDRTKADTFSGVGQK